MDEVRSLELNKDQTNFLMECIDTHVRTKGIVAAGNCFIIANKLGTMWKDSQPEEENDDGESNTDV